MMNTHITKHLLRKLLCTSHWKTFSFSLQDSGRHLISLPRFLRDRVCKVGNIVEALTLWNECTPERTVSWNVSFWFLFEDSSVFTIVFTALRNITFSILQEQCSNTALWEKNYNSLTGQHTSQSIISESFSTVFIRRHFLGHHRPPGAT